MRNYELVMVHVAVSGPQITFGWAKTVFLHGHFSVLGRYLFNSEAHRPICLRRFEWVRAHARII